MLTHLAPWSSHQKAVSTPAARGQEPQLRPGRGAGEAAPKAPRGPRGSASFLHPWAGGCGCSGTAGGCAPTQVGRGWGSGPLRQVLPTRMWPSTRGQTPDKHSRVPGPAPRAPGCGGRSGGPASPPGVLRGAGEGPARHPGCGPPKAWEGWPSTAGAPGGGGGSRCPRETSVLKEDAALGSRQKQSRCFTCCC